MIKCSFFKSHFWYGFPYRSDQRSVRVDINPRHFMYILVATAMGDFWGQCEMYAYTPYSVWDCMFARNATT